jgi:SAM-dependent methyltransferase
MNKNMMILYQFVSLNYIMSITDQFSQPKLQLNNLDIYIVRKTILSALQENLPKLSGTLLDVGCGYMPYKQLLLSSASKVEEYIGLDLANNIYQKPDLEWDGQKIPLEDNIIDCIIATEVFEHCPEPEIVMKEIYRVLKPDGILFFTVPFLWPLHTVPYDEYRYTPFSLERHLTNSGFKDIEIKALGGWDKALAQMLGLWLKRRLGKARSRKLIILSKLLSILCFPLIFLLIKLDQLPVTFSESSMITGLTGTAQKL